MISARVSSKIVMLCMSFMLLLPAQVFPIFGLTDAGMNTLIAGEKTLMRGVVASGFMLAGVICCYFGIKTLVKRNTTLSKRLGYGLGFVSLGIAAIVLSPYGAMKVCARL